MTPMLSCSYAVNDTPLSAWTVRICLPRPRSTLERRSAAVGRLPVANTLYSTCTSSTITTGLRSLGGWGAWTWVSSVDTAVPLLSAPEEPDAEREQADR